MAISRYYKIEPVLNSDKDYKVVFSKRFNSKGLMQLPTNTLDYPSEEYQRQFQYIDVFWGVGERLYKLSHKYYGDAKYWWVIAWFNKKSHEQAIEIGEHIRIPMPIDEVLNSLGF